MIRGSIYKIISVLIIIGLNWTGLSAIGGTFAFFNDNEVSPGNNYTATTLDFSLSSLSDFFPLTPDESNQLLRNISVIQEGASGFQYEIQVTEFLGGLCGDLQLSANLDDGDEEVECPTSSLVSFSCGPLEISDGLDDWQFTASLPGGAPGVPCAQACDFKLTFKAWQTNLPSFAGFSDIEEIESKVIKHYPELFPQPDIVLNEFLPDPVGNDDALSPNGEWVELYNRGSATATLAGWYLSDANNNQLPIPTSTVAPKGFLVVYLNGAFSPEWLDNIGDMIVLWAPESAVELSGCFNGYCLVDAHFYTAAEVFEGKSFARIPDGSEIWYDPVPTPGVQNQLSEEELMTNLQPQIIALSQEQLFQAFINHSFKELILGEIPDETGGGTDYSSMPDAAEAEAAATTTDDVILATTTEDMATTTEDVSASTTDEEVTTTEATSTDDIATTTDEDITTTSEDIAATTTEDAVSSTTDEEVSTGEATTTEATTTEEEAPVDETDAEPETPEPAPAPAPESEPAVEPDPEPEPEPAPEPEPQPEPEVPAVEESQPAEEPVVEEEPVIMPEEDGGNDSSDSDEGDANGE